VPFELVPAGTHIDFIGKRRIAAAISFGLILASLIAIPIRGIRLGIDFAGGNEVQVRFSEGVIVDEGAIRGVIAGMPSIEAPTVVRYGTESEQEFLIRFAGADEAIAFEGDQAGEAAPSPSDRVELLESALREGVGELSIQRVEFVGPSVGQELQTDGLLSLLWATLAIMIYVAIRFSSRFAPGAVIALIHDLIVTAGIFVILGLEFNLQVLAAMLAILGYSLNDTIIIYDRIRENLALRTSADMTEVLNLSVNQTLSRTVLTSGTTLLALMSLFLLGGDVIRPFAFAMLIGVVVGTYSSIFIASPLLLSLDTSGGKVKKKTS
jgi:preprotein translocase subunit SecF